MRAVVLWTGLVAGLAAGCARGPDAASTVMSPATGAGDEGTTQARIGIPSELRPEPATEVETVEPHRPEVSPPPTEEPPAEELPAEAEELPAEAEEPPAEEPPTEEPPQASPEASEIAGWDYLRTARQHVAHTYRDEIQACFDAAFRRGPVSGRLVLAMVPHADGRVAASRVVDDETGDRALGGCLVDAAQRWVLPEPPRRTLEVQLRFSV